MNRKSFNYGFFKVIKNYVYCVWCRNVKQLKLNYIYDDAWRYKLGKRKLLRDFDVVKLLKTVRDN